MDQTHATAQSRVSEMLLINLALSEEIEALNSIYGEGTLCFLSAKDDKIVTKFRLPAPLEADRIAFHLVFPFSYPESPPEYRQMDVDLYQSLDRRVQNISIIVWTSLKQVFVPGNVCIFDLIDFVLPIVACMRGQSVDVDAATNSCSQIPDSDWRWTSRPFINMNIVRETTKCYICCDEDYTFKMIRMPCEHQYCFDCFQTGWDLAAKECDPYTCCGRRIPLRTICEHTNISDEAAKDYVSMLVDRDTPSPFYCGFVGCGFLVGEISVWKLARGSTKRHGIKCPKCQQSTCARCRSPVHVGECVTDREMLKLFQRADIRRCLKCGAPIEKNGGCSHIQCRACKSHFTWNERGGLGRYEGMIYELNG